MRVVLLCHAVTEGVRRARFGGDDVPGPDALVAAGSLALPRVDRLLSAPSAACRRTASALGPALPEVEVDGGLRGCDYGRWTGRSLDEVQAAEPEALARWAADPHAAPHGGESLAALHARIGDWLDGQEPARRAVLAVADAAVVRAAVVHAVEAHPRSLWRIDVAPLGLVVLAGKPGRWSLRELARR